jgi:hypothetical protein
MFLSLGKVILHPSKLNLIKEVTPEAKQLKRYHGSHEPSSCRGLYIFWWSHAFHLGEVEGKTGSLLF